MGLIGLGYVTVSTIVFLLGAVVGGVHSRLRFASVALIRDILEGLVAVVKVGMLLFLRIFLLPLALGGLILRCANILIEYPIEAWVEFTTSNVIGLLSLNWVLGISYMMVVTLSVLQLREVLHPDILAKVIHPQEAHLDLLSSLLHESGPTHARRITASMLVYIVLIALFVATPAHVMRMVLGSPLKIYTWSLISELRVPVELGLLHLSFLTLLEKHKLLVGKLQYSWLRYACRRLGLSRFLLPFQRRRVAERSSTSSAHAGSIATIEIVADAPMRRPPDGWSLQPTNDTKRWSWGHEIPSELEQSLAARVSVPHWPVRLCALMVLSWLLVLSLVVAMLAMPLVIGRAVYSLVGLPTALQHDTFNFAFGLAFCVVIYNGLFRGHRGQCIFTSLWLAATQGSEELKIMLQRLSYMCGFICPLSLGFIVRVALMHSPMLTTIFAPGNLFKCWLSGLVLHGIAGVVLSGRLLLLLRVRANNANGLRAPVESVQAAWTLLTAALERCEARDWPSLLHKLIILHYIYVLPYRNTFRGKAVSYFMTVFVPTTLVAAYLIVFHSNETPELQLVDRGLGFVTWVSIWLFIFTKAVNLTTPLARKIMTALYCSIRDENYLIGRQLKNNREVRVSELQTSGDTSEPSTVTP